MQTLRKSMDAKPTRLAYLTGTDQGTGVSGATTSPARTTDFVPQRSEMADAAHRIGERADEGQYGAYVGSVMSLGDTGDAVLTVNQTYPCA